MVEIINELCEAMHWVGVRINRLSTSEFPGSEKQRYFHSIELYIRDAIKQAESKTEDALLELQDD